MTKCSHAYAKLFEKEVIPCMEKRALSATVYTQLSDVEGEINGLYTYDRKTCKVDKQAMLALADELNIDCYL